MLYIPSWLHFTHFNIFFLLSQHCSMSACFLKNTKLKGNINIHMFISRTAVTWDINTNNPRGKKGATSVALQIRWKRYHFQHQSSPSSLSLFCSAQLFKTGSQAWYCHSQPCLMLSLDLSFVFNEATVENPSHSDRMWALNGLSLSASLISLRVWDVNLRLCSDSIPNLRGNVADTGQFNQKMDYYWNCCQFRP